MDASFVGELSRLVADNGYWAIVAIIALESMGIPAPGETALIAAAIYAGTTHRLDITLVIACAAAGAIMGDNIGYWLGRRFGHPLLVRYGRYIGLSDRRIRLGQYLCLRYGGRILVAARFVALIRAVAAFLAGANEMPWSRFLVANAVGGLMWTVGYGVGAYYFGEQLQRAAWPLGLALLAAASAVLVGSFLFIRRHEAQFEAEAERVIPVAVHPGG